MNFNINLLLQHYGYFGVFFVIFMEVLGIPFPAETTLTISGIEWSKGVFQLLPLLLTAIGGNVVGSTIAYCIGRTLGRPVILKFGRYIGITEKRLHKAGQIFQKNQRWIVVFGKFILGIRVLIPYLAGINKMNVVVFTILNAISAILWVSLFVLLGNYIGVEWAKYHTVLGLYIKPCIIIALILIMALIVIKIVRLRKILKRN